MSQRFWNKVEKTKTCWLWIGAKIGSKYGVIKVNQKNILAHRFSWELHRGEIPEGEGFHGICVLHSCDNRNCVNPKHLFLGTQKDNMIDKVKKKRQAKGNKIRNSKLSKKDVQLIRKLYFDDRTYQRILGEKFGVSQMQISNIVRNKHWKHI